jgi:GT2 family glycosyltransferase
MQRLILQAHSGQPGDSAHVHQQNTAGTPEADSGAVRFSVVIPTCGRPAALAECLDRLAPGRQDLSSAFYEVVVADDGADNVSARALVARDYPWARWVAGPRRGPAANRNSGAAQARGGWFVFTDDDCLPSSCWLAAFAAHLDHHPESQVLEGRTDDGGAPPAGPFFTAPLNTGGGFLWSCNMAIARPLFIDLGGFDENFPYPHMEDVDLRLRLEDRGVRYEFVRDACVDHLPRPLGSAWKWARSRESSYYLAAKRGVSAERVGFSVATYARACMRSFRHCRNAWEFVLVTGRIVAEIFLLVWQIPLWQWRYRRGLPPAGA